MLLVIGDNICYGDEHLGQGLRVGHGHLDVILVSERVEQLTVTRGALIVQGGSHKLDIPGDTFRLETQRIEQLGKSAHRVLVVAGDRAIEMLAHHLGDLRLLLFHDHGHCVLHNSATPQIPPDLNVLRSLFVAARRHRMRNLLCTVPQLDNVIDQRQRLTHPALDSVQLSHLARQLLGGAAGLAERLLQVVYLPNHSGRMCGGKVAQQGPLCAAQRSCSEQKPVQLLVQSMLLLG
mmetsp:Transcript_25139/g.57118  ORF Transcript_25139/g.57118 Transcript_25139/m.57118 type:complete len:235 (+) Transcript_25139:352-1056(+)